MIFEHVHHFLLIRTLFLGDSSAHVLFDGLFLCANMCHWENYDIPPKIHYYPHSSSAVSTCGQLSFRLRTEENCHDI
jgi:hypothetical protein